MAAFPAVFFTVMMALAGVSFGAVYKVGDRSLGWTTNFDYISWSHSKKFIAGDVLVFEYNPFKQNLVQVNREQFKACKFDHPLFASESGNNSITLIPGNFFYLSTVPGQCQAGLKLHVKVYRPSSGPSPKPTPLAHSPTRSPSDSPSPTPSAQSPSPAALTLSPSRSRSGSPSPSGSRVSSPSRSMTGSPRRSPIGSPKPSPTGTPSQSPRSSQSQSPVGSPNATRVGSQAPTRSPRIPSPHRLNPPPLVPKGQNPPPQMPQTPKAPTARKSNASPHSSNGLSLVHVLTVVAMLAFIA